MKKLLLLVALFPIIGFAQSEKNPCETLSKINAVIQEQHYKPKPIDDSLSVYVFNTFLKHLDENNSLFIEPEISILKKHLLKLDDYILSKNCTFLDDFYTTYNQAIDRYENTIATINTHIG